MPRVTDSRLVHRVERHRSLSATTRRNDRTFGALRKVTGDGRHDGFYDAVRTDKGVSPRSGPSPLWRSPAGVADNRFTIASQRPGVLVCWQVTGARKDPRANAHRVEVEETKTGEEQTQLLCPAKYHGRTKD